VTSGSKLQISIWITGLVLSLWGIVQTAEGGVGKRQLQEHTRTGGRTAMCIRQSGSLLLKGFK
jgi:hypothetical protein